MPVADGAPFAGGLIVRDSEAIGQYKATKLSRIDDAQGWAALLHALGFDHRATDASNTHFVLYEHVKSKRPPAETLPRVRLKACQYKKR